MNVPQTPAGYTWRDFVVFIGLWIILVIIRFILPVNIFPDLLGLARHDAGNCFTLILTTAAALLGILAAVLLLSFQMLSREAKRRKEGNVLHNPWLLAFAGLSGFLLVAATLCYITVPNFSDDTNLTIGYYLFYCFIAFLLLTFPAIRIMLDNTNSLQQVYRQIKALQLDDFKKAHEIYQDGNWQSGDLLQVGSVRDEVRYAIREKDNAALSNLLNLLTQKANKLLTPDLPREDAEKIILVLVLICKDAEAETGGQNASFVYEMISSTTESLLQHAATEKVPLVCYHRLRFFYSDLAVNRARADDLTALPRIVHVLHRCFTAHLEKNCPPQQSLKFLLSLFRQPEGVHDTAAEIQWDSIVEFIEEIKKIQELAIEHGMKDVYIDASRNLESLVYSINEGHFPALEEYQRAKLLVEILPLGMFRTGEDALHAGLFENTTRSLRVDGSRIAKIITDDGDAARLVVTSLGDDLIKALRRGKLTVWTLNEFGSIPRHTAEHYQQNRLVQQVTDYVFEVLKLMKTELESGEVMEQPKIYDEVKNQLRLLFRDLEESVKPNKLPIVEEIKECLNSFQKNSKMKDDHIVPWPALR